MYSLLRFLPRNHLSYIFGRLASTRPPQFIAGPLNRTFANTFGANLDESALPPEQYRSLQEYFLRDLKPGLRPIGPGVVSPADGKVVEHGPIDHDRLIQAKGKYYSLKALVRDEKLATAFAGGYFVTVYLAPKNYHHVHSPLDGEVTSCYYIPGTLWPVNNWSVENVSELFCVNERLITVLQTAIDLVAVVMVGATNVGRISVTYDTLESNTLSRLRGRFPPLVKRDYTPRPTLRKGDRLGSFHLGSTVVLLFQHHKFTPGPGCTPGEIRFGQTISE